MNTGSDAAGGERGESWATQADLRDAFQVGLDALGVGPDVDLFSPESGADERGEWIDEDTFVTVVREYVTMGGDQYIGSCGVTITIYTHNPETLVKKEETATLFKYPDDRFEVWHLPDRPIAAVEWDQITRSYTDEADASPGGEVLDEAIARILRGDEPDTPIARSEPDDDIQRVLANMDRERTTQAIYGESGTQIARADLHRLTTHARRIVP